MTDTSDDSFVNDMHAMLALPGIVVWGVLLRTTGQVRVADLVADERGFRRTQITETPWSCGCDYWCIYQRES